MRTIKILFVCVENSCRSQIAEGLVNHLSKKINKKIKAYSAGSKPIGKVDPLAIEVMREINIDISLQKSKNFKDLFTKNFDYVVTLGCKEICPFVPAKKYVHWKIEDPKGKDIEFFRKIRDKIKKKIEELLKEI